MATTKKKGQAALLRHKNIGQKNDGFRVAARTLIHLGRELITSDEIAINELIKNAFDAGSPKVAVRLVCPVSTQALALVQDAFKKSRSPLPLRVKTAAEQLQEAAAKEAAAKDAADKDSARTLGKETEEHFRLILRRLQSSTTVEDAISSLEEVNFVEVSDTGCGISESNILPVFLTVGTDYKLTESKPPGQDAYLGNKGIGRLAMMRLGDRAKVTTWTADASRASVVEFDWRLFDDGKRQIGEIPVPRTRIKKPSTSASGTVVRVVALRSDWTKGRVEKEGLQGFIRRLRNPFSKTRAFRIKVSVNDNVSIAFPPLSEEVKGFADQTLTLTFSPGRISKGKEELLEVVTKFGADDSSSDTQSRSTLALCEKLTVKPEELSAIGPFKLTLMRFNRRKLREKAAGQARVVRLELDLWSGGIAIYRDGFRVGFTGSARDGDWLGLDSKALREGGFVVNRIQVIGALEITHKHNSRLIDLTNREGLVSTPEAELLKQILLEFGINPLRAVIAAEEQKEKQKEFEKLINDGTSTLNDRLELAQRDIAVLKDGVSASLKPAVASLDKHLHFISTQVVKFESAILKAGEGREHVLELAGVGNVMFGVMHELVRNTSQTRKLLRDLSADADEATLSLLAKLEDEIKAINTRLRQLDPLMPDARHTKRDMDVGKLAHTVVAGYASRLKRHDIDAVVTITPEDAETKVRMVPGFLSLALENLMSNSVHWVKERADKTVRGLIEIEIDATSNVITVTDNGPGIEPNDRERVFNPGFSLRAKGKGYGLYLAREVAEYHGGKLYLDGQTNDLGQLSTFILELPGPQA